MDSIIYRKLKYFGHIKRHSGLEKTIMEGIVPGRRSRGQLVQKWTQDVQDTLGMKIHKAGGLPIE